ncbi:synaptonemal complex protein 3-like [Meles meles]|uniref:synaptonemal complex protein 3-like n=1 Tax=Meles meles TaxID=9662 RepID=UPI001E6989EB|nr:synaptonemal complex protein 3-like [Meles meles]XP_045852358.1 synaptonemal complex protein 3-like [Meles meles]
MPPAGSKRLGRAAKAPVEAQGMAAYDLGRQERRQLSGPEVAGNNPVTHERGRKRPSAETFEEDVGNEVRKMLQGLGADIKQALLAKRTMFEMNTKASVKTTNEKIEHVWKIQQEERQNLRLKYSRQFLTLFWEWDADMRKAQEQEEKLAGMFQEQRKLLQQARVVQNQRLQKIKKLYEQFSESTQDLEKEHERLLADEQREVREEMTKLQDKIMMEAQRQKLAIVQKHLHSLLF